MKAPALKEYNPASAAMAGAALESSGPQQSSESSLNDDDARCYSARYQDIDALLDPKAHFSSTGLQQGRLGTCAKRLTDYEALRYI